MSAAARDKSFRAEALAVERSGRHLLSGVGLELVPGELHALLGANGAGKSTLLRVMAGEFPANSGTVQLAGQLLRRWSSRERACLRAVLPQFDILQVDFLANEVVALGRTPCWRLSPGEERDLVASAMARTGAASLAGRRYLSLSGGERARVQLARVLVQVSGPLLPQLEGLPRFLLLDEPTASLDLGHRHACLALAQSLAQEGYGVLAILHEPDLAMRYADRVTVLKDGRVIGQGEVGATLSSELLQQAYDMPIERIQIPGRARAVLLA